MRGQHVGEHRALTNPGKFQHARWAGAVKRGKKDRKQQEMMEGREAELGLEGVRMMHVISKLECTLRESEQRNK